MLEQNKKTTNYLRKAVLAQVDKTIDFKNDEFYKISKENLIKGIIDPQITEKLFENNKKEMKKIFSEGTKTDINKDIQNNQNIKEINNIKDIKGINNIEEIKNTKSIKNIKDIKNIKCINNIKNIEDSQSNKIDENIYVILAVKVIKTEVEGTQKKGELEDLTCIYYIPAMLNKKTSALLPSIESNKLPWFPREILKPMIEPELAIGDGEIYDQVVSDEVYNIYKIVTWKEYIDYCKHIYESTTQSEFEKDEIYNMNGRKEKILLEKNVYIFLDKTINPSYHVRKLYNNIIKQDRELKLYENFISLQEAENKENVENTIEQRKKHYAQMGGQYGLSPSQREAINHYNNIKEGEILAIKGPPGTGKTTLLQSVVASKYVEKAIAEDIPPLTVATSTNNQAVTNIIESFGKIAPKFNNNLETRWIEKINSFAMYFPSKQKQKSAKQKGYMYTTNKGEYSLSEIDNEKNIKTSKENYLKQMEKMFPDVKTLGTRNIMTYKEEIHEKLVNINNIQNNIIDFAQEIKNIIDGNDIKAYIVQKQDLIETLKHQKQENIKKVEFWKSKYKEVPKLWKAFSWTKKYKEKISNYLKLFVEAEEDFNDETINIDLIESYYAKKAENHNEQIKEATKKIETIGKYILKYQNELKKLTLYDIDISDIQENLIVEEEKLDIWLDTTTRYVSFWLAVHYYEARWLQGEYALTSKQKGTTYNNVLINFYTRLSMIVPCLVMTFYMLPRQFLTYNEESDKQFLYEMIDTLIVDEAGQVSTEIAACSFALAKKAIVVGDEKQIQPVWGIDRPLDKSLAIQEEAIQEENQFKKLEECGLTASNSSVMRAACKACNYSKYGEKGLLLTEHRRCFDDIIQYCNELVYKGQLKPLRGNGNNEKNLDILPKMGYYMIKSTKSKKVGTSRTNTIEAAQIANWILKNYKTIFAHYSKVDKDKVLGVITPFKEQAKEIRKIFNEMLPANLKNIITVGTVHVFQGGERKIIIMSTTYGREDGCFFIDYNKNLMNVAVSRAEDSFLIFGDVNCLKDEEQSPSGLLKKHIRIKNNGGIRGCSLNPAIINLVIINLAIINLAIINLVIINLAIINLVIINFATINSTITNSKIKSIHHIF